MSYSRSEPGLEPGSPLLCRRRSRTGRVSPAAIRMDSSVLSIARVRNVARRHQPFEDLVAEEVELAAALLAVGTARPACTASCPRAPLPAETGAADPIGTRAAHPDGPCPERHQSSNASSLPRGTWSAPADTPLGTVRGSRPRSQDQPSSRTILGVVSTLNAPARPDLRLLPACVEMAILIGYDGGSP